MKISVITDYLEAIAPLEYQESYDNAGYITGNGSNEAKGALICLDSTEEVILEAIDRNCNLVIAHHPIIFRGIKKITGQHYIDRAIILALKHDISIYAIHTNLDNVLELGVNQKIAEKIGLTNVRILKPKADDPKVGSGVSGELSQAQKFDAFASYLKRQMDVKVLRHTRIIGENVRKVALCGGSGRFLLPEAIRQGADVFISSDFKYHEFFDANDQITIIDIGHYESEKFTIELLHEVITGKFSNFAAYCTKVDTNPIKYI